MRFLAIPNYTPHRIAFGLTPSALRLPLKGGVVPLSSDSLNSSLPEKLTQETMALLRILALGNRHIEADQVRPAADHVARLLERRQTP